VDVTAYLRRVGLAEEDLPPTVASLRRLHRAHVDAIPFANVGPALGRVPALDLPTLERRMVGEGRGGYCLEHVTLFAAVLRSVGFGVEVRLCFVGPGEPERGRPPTHLTVLARPEDDSRRWMADVGFGVGVLGPVPLGGGPVRHGAWEHRADVADDGRIRLFERDGAGWRQLHVSVDADAQDDEIVSANRWVALQEGSPFAGKLVAMRTTDDRRERLRGRTFEVVDAGAEPVVDELSAVSAVEALQRRFGVAIDAADRAALEALLGG
jgi:N-hydroxyarylamine O-acetyltransferase